MECHANSKSLPKPYRPIAKQVVSQKGSVTTSSNGHPMFRNPEGRVVAVGSGSPRTDDTHNLKADLRRGGFAVRMTMFG